MLFNRWKYLGYFDLLLGDGKKSKKSEINGIKQSKNKMFYYRKFIHFYALLNINFILIHFYK